MVLGPAEGLPGGGWTVLDAVKRIGAERDREQGDEMR
jgi:hypothetical protein